LIWVAVVLLAVSLASVAVGVLLRKDSRDGQSNEALLGRPVSANDQVDKGDAASENGGVISPAVPELIFKQPTSSPSPQPTEGSLFSQSVPIAAILELPTRMPASSPTSEVVQTLNAPSEQSTPVPTPFPSPLPFKATSNPMAPLSFSSIQTPKPSSSQVGGKTTYTANLKVSRDTYIRSTASDWNYGSSEFLRVDRDPRSIAVMAFDINVDNELLESSRRQYNPSKEKQSHENRRVQTSQLTVKVKTAKLRLYSLEESDTGGEVYALTNAKIWQEDELTWNNAKDEVHASGEALIGSIDNAVEEGLWYEVDITNAFDCCVETVGSMHLNVLVRSDSSDGVTYASKEYQSGSFAPRLILTYSFSEMVSSNLASIFATKQYF
jgi:hypothetical protein